MEYIPLTVDYLCVVKFTQCQCIKPKTAGKDQDRGLKDFMTLSDNSDSSGVNLELLVPIVEVKKAMPWNE